MELTGLVIRYGIEITVIGILAIMCVGAVKMIFKKQLANIGKPNSKVIYETASIVFAFILTCLWLLITKEFDWKGLLEKGALVYVAVNVMYPLYENYRLRDLFKLLVGLVIKEEDKTEIGG